MKCKHCDYMTDSHKIFSGHQKNCLQIQKENGLLDKKAPAQNPPKSGADALSWNELKKFATKKGINVHGKRKEDILQELSTLEDKKPSDELGGGQNDNNSGEGKNNPSDNNNG